MGKWREASTKASSKRQGSCFRFSSLWKLPGLAISQVFSATQKPLMTVRRKLASVLWFFCRFDSTTSLQISYHQVLVRVPFLGHRGYGNHLEKFFLTPESGERKSLMQVLTTNEPIKKILCFLAPPACTYSTST